MTCSVGEVTIPPNQSFTTTLKVKAEAPAGAPTGGLQSTAFTDFTTAEGQTIGKTSASVALAPPGQAVEPDEAGQNGVEGGAAPAAPDAPPKQIAPGKKSEAPLGKNPLLKLASFRPQVPTDQSLIHKVGGAGGNIGGAGAPRQSPCRKFLRDGFSIQQSNGFPVSFTGLTQINSKLFGTATFISSEGPVTGRVTGTVGPSDFNIVVEWSNGSRGTYTGTIAPGGNASGRTVDNAGGSATFTSVAPLVCVEDEACFKYAKDAGLRARVFASEKCGVPPEGRWSMVDKHHLDLCMSLPSNSVKLDEENTARLNELRDCQARNAAIQTRCETFASEGVVGPGVQR